MKKYLILILLLVTTFNLNSQSSDNRYVSRFHFPLPEQYRYYISSGQGLRDIIPAESAGASTSGKWHNGFDFVCPNKTPVYAAKSGVVTEVYPSYYNGPYEYKGHPIYGGLIVISHYDGTITLYAHLSFTKVREGTIVYKGQEIGWSGGVKGRRGSGISTGPHLHFAIYLNYDGIFY